ncbi:MAG: hypothetical protein GF421_04840 [Candidatus Aminicenantes bacterium]|nr:hypothetical protein [Candidatus Aminicenantes bacterium]
MKKKNIRVAIIDNSIDRNIYDPVQHWSRFLDVEWDSFQAKNSDFPQNGAKDFTHIILTGSEASIMDRPDWVLKEVEFVKQAVAQKISVLGSCYGHQMIALALKGPKCVRRSFSPEIGWIPIHNLKKDVMFGTQDCLYSFTIHFDEVTGLGDDFVILAETDLCPVHAFRKKQASVWGIQSHPEINPEEGKRLLKKLYQQGIGPVSFYKEALHSAPRDSGIIESVIDTFFKY